MEQPAVSRQQVGEIAASIFPAAAVALYSSTAAQQAVAEAMTAAIRKVPPAALYTESLRRMMQICNARSGETPQEDIFPADSPLAAAARLPFPSRADLALLAGSIPDEDAARVMNLPAEELEKRYEKALRQMTFLRDGDTPAIPECQADAAALLTPEIRSALTDRIMQNEAARIAEEKQKKNAEKHPAETVKIRQIVRNVPRGEQAGHGATVPLWAMIAAVAVIAVLAGLLGWQLLRDRRPEGSHSAEESLPASIVQRAEELKYVGMEKAQEEAIWATGYKPEDIVIISSKLTADGNDVRYEVTLAARERGAYVVTLNAVTGAVLAKPRAAEDVATEYPDAKQWLPLSQLRAMALECANLEKAVFTKEKLGTSGEIHYYKFEFTSADGKEYTVHENALTGALMKYSVKEPAPAEANDLISAEKARSLALSRTGADASQVIFTKEKLEGTVWLFAMTLDDGTQYTIELNAQTGMANTVDVHPVSADTSGMTGMIAAKNFAVKKAGLTDDDSLHFTKAKIDRGGGAYVYELAFENDEYEYEVTLHAKTGEILKFRTAAL